MFNGYGLSTDDAIRHYRGIFGMTGDAIWRYSGWWVTLSGDIRDDVRHHPTLSGDIRDGDVIGGYPGRRRHRGIFGNITPTATTGR